MEKEIIPPVAKDLLKSELTKDKFLRTTNYGGNELYIITAHDSPHLMREIGRLREISFRLAGGGTDKEMDIDHFDTQDVNPYKQLIVWDPDDNEILGGYRFMFCGDLPVVPGKEVGIATAKLFHFSDQFLREYFPYMIELGRSFVQPLYQSTAKAKKSIYALDNLWDGLGAIWHNLPESKYFFGKVTMYPRYNKQARNTLLYFLDKYFGGNEHLVRPFEPMDTAMDRIALAHIFHGKTYKEDYKTLSKIVKDYGEKIPPLINSYMNLSPSMKVFGTVINPYFGGVEETAILITMQDMYESKSERHVKSFIKAQQGYNFIKRKLGY